MALESGVYINSLDAANPAATDPLAQADDHIKLIKSTVKASFPNISGAMTASHTVLNGLDTRVTALETNGGVAIVNNSGTPELGSGVTAQELRQLLDLHTNDAVTFATINGTNINATSTVDCNVLDIGQWTITETNNDLRFSYGGVAKFKITSAGAIIAVNDVTGFGAV